MKKKSVLDKIPDRLIIRERLGISQENYATFCGVSKSMLSMIEINERNWPMGSSNHSWITIDFNEAEKNPPDLSVLE